MPSTKAIVGLMTVRPRPLVDLLAMGVAYGAEHLGDMEDALRHLGGHAVAAVAIGKGQKDVSVAEACLAQIVQHWLSVQHAFYVVHSRKLFYQVGVAIDGHDMMPFFRQHRRQVQSGALAPQY